ncbi:MULTISPECIES: DHH family phosphoesterase [unclassified Pseudoalteromonas]|jgi:nanoRNase/pAp phosphatase (c-di-AMP/oligoRNAs hydrolase)|uniref:DHH family phosphoesterase n=1 Tax=unclassified Pseudoalteromonas TaxID=194690 RepID=UPI000B699D6C|nr:MULTISPECIES: DHH family phosphoesterase [unclassified Pseudoalteromonas]MAJ40086.1 DHH family phosphoesterase [Pseudoalteromonadaceae bacterium]OUX88486.1 MAG: DHH family phosphoesterase [Pseudoalteromonas sp. TMED43]MDC9564926.1 DHH family phosphoesterase [Pseudoalteromonas sp. GAB2316C]MDC9569328.1 DHH family phosphoesterase [Pseudoalteromonas sp. GABNB9D]MDC9574193.1 DHH family phosphoesterase [Pseudoalteromonas sp. GABNS16A]|tara:strand:- start:1186 stop:2172 length:987 start_codon:yes stop_codon:yes gene_type:complete
MKSKEEILAFIKRLSPLQRVIIQAHDFPDHDAISSAYALSVLLSHYEISTLIVYNGEIDRISLSNLIQWLEIPIYHCSQVRLNPSDKIINVDGCIGEKNVTDVPGDEIAVIDHHTVKPSKSFWFEDIRSDYGATATIIWEYYQLLGIKMSIQVASALLVGLNVDTANMTRGFCKADIKAFVYLNARSDLAFVNRVLRNTLMQGELRNFELAFRNLSVNDGVASVILPEPCPKNMLGMLGDFLLSVNEFDVVIVAVKQNNGLQLSFRSECQNVDVGRLARETLNNTNRGFGGGHRHMAGGIVLPEYISMFTEKNNHFKPFIKKISEWRA